MRTFVADGQTDGLTDRRAWIHRTRVRVQKKLFVQKSTDEQSPGFWVVLSFNPYVLLGVRNLEGKKSQEDVWLYHHTHLAFMVLPFGLCVFVNGGEGGGVGRGREGRDLPLVLAKLILFPPSL